MQQPRLFAIYVRSRHEGRVAQHLAARDVELFFPHGKEERIWSDRKVEIEVPLFAGYLFVRIDLQDRMRVLEAPGVLYLVGASGRPEALEDAEIEQLKAAMSKSHDPRPHKFIRVGDRVMVTRGPLAGCEGFLLKDKNKSRVVLNLNFIERAMSVEVDADEIQPMNDGFNAYRIAAGIEPLPGTRGEI